MAIQPITRFCLAGRDPVPPGAPLWGDFLPDSRTGDSHKPHRITYGQYFQAVVDFLWSDNLAAVCRTAGKKLQRDLFPADIQSISISLEKHGQYYHPAKVDVAFGDRSLPFVVNAAVTPEGQNCLDQDVALLSRIGTAFPYRYLPEMYRSGTRRLPGSQETISLALGEWLEHYCEFHLTKCHDGDTRLALWHPIQGKAVLSASQAGAIISNTAMVMTAYYDIETFEHISAWHMAAGDVVARADLQQPDVRIITVRRYIPLLEAVVPETESMFYAAVLFFMKLSLRLRLDRLDGTGDMVWADDAYVPAIVTGFFSGLSLQSAAERIPPAFVDLMRSHLASLTLADIEALIMAVYQRISWSSEEKDLVGSQLTGHISALKDAFARLS